MDLPISYSVGLGLLLERLHSLVEDIDLLGDGDRLSLYQSLECIELTPEVDCLGIDHS